MEHFAFLAFCKGLIKNESELKETFFSGYP